MPLYRKEKYLSYSSGGAFQIIIKLRKDIVAIKFYIAIIRLYFIAYSSAMIDKYATVQLLLQSKDENIWSILNMYLSPDFKPLDYGKSLIPKRKLKELHKINEAYKK